MGKVLLVTYHFYPLCLLQDWNGNSASSGVTFRFGTLRYFSRLGMTGWIRVRGVNTHYYPSKDEDAWPPRFVKFILKIAEPKTKPTFEGSLIPDIWGTEIAFVDARRLGRVRLVNAKDPFTEPYSIFGDWYWLKPFEWAWIRSNSQDARFRDFRKWCDEEEGVKNVCTVWWKVPIKALLLDQSFSAGVGNWVA